ncbi:CbtB-domain containing protein [Caldinitratiruptor microaerophilus]|uniref:Cobalt transporter subunit (CbtB) n=1 Tax=Caldinitratiruptor microaerophilus TaxID=671077 RepID=A0AA35GAQ8_9FIRM|nr:CbtB-domain containing protein [Caldinitratiruptor microaerophilus]BDG61564.1 hypothetical protein caldi_26540 [Caldinitratiruptor microaerophilus]
MNEVSLSLRGLTAVRHLRMGGWPRYLLLQGVLWLSVPVALYVLFAAPIPAVHDALHSVRHFTAFFTCH